MLNSKINKVNIDNFDKISEYEENIDFSTLKPEIKTIALYFPQFHAIEENDKFWGKGFTEWNNVKKGKPRFKGNHQPRIPGDKYGYLDYYDLTDINVIKKQIKLAKSHGIYGFGIYYYWFSGKEILGKPLNILIKNIDIKFRFLIIWANENWTRRWDGKDNEILLKQEYKHDDPMNFIKDIKKYIIDKRYIKIDEKPVLGLYEPNKIPKLTKTIKIWRKKSREIGIGEVFILICINQNKTEDFEKLNLFDASYEFPPRNLNNMRRILKKKTYIYSEILLKSKDFKETNINFTKFPFFRGSMVEWDNCPRTVTCGIFDHYSPEKFYLFNKNIIDWTIKHYNKDLRFIFINAWNEWGEGTYLEPDDKYGYASINSLSKAIFNISYSEQCTTIGFDRIAVLIKISEENSIKEIINKISNIPYLYDLIIIICKNEIKKYISLNSNIYFFGFNYFLNNNNDNLLDFLFKNKDKKYKYICNINSNKYKNINYYEEWKNYILNNLLGNTQIISEIITDFEKNIKLGMIFPERYYKTLEEFGDNINDLEFKYVTKFLNKIFPNIRINQTVIDFPEGNMFWAKISSIYPIYNLYRKILLTKTTFLILQDCLEKLWVYLVKLNGFEYKTIFKHL